MKLTIFYSWQENTDKNLNKNFIRDCINLSVTNIKNQGQLKGIQFEIQESTSNLPGTPDVNSIIEQRISDCDIFIGDLSFVNAYSCLEKIIRKVSRKKLQYFINNNVYGEFNRALSCLGWEHVIGVTNIVYGDPNENELLIPFDTRGKRFLITYELKNEKNKEKALIELTKKLENAIRLSALAVIEKGKSKYRPFIQFSEHIREPRNQERFFENDFIANVKQEIFDNKQNIRILGLSGLGKTRIVLEAFKKSDDFSLSYLYCDAYLEECASILATIDKIIANNEKVYLVVDNCSEVLHKKILYLKSKKHNPPPLITINNDLEENESTECSYIRIPKSMNDIVDFILEKEVNKIDKNVLSILSDGEEYWKYHNFKNLLGAMIGSPSSLNDIFFQEKNYDKFLLWCDSNPKIAPIRLAAITPVYQGNSFHPFVNFLLDIYGNNTDVLDSLSSNMGSFSWVGSVIPMYELKKKSLEQLLSHKNQIIVEWAKKQIEYTQREIYEAQLRKDEEKLFYG